MGKPILAIVDDLLFLSKIGETARLVGVSVRTADPQTLTKALADNSAVAVILDLNNRSIPVLDVIRNLKSDTRAKAVPILGFVSHVQSDLIASAREAGCDVVLARSAFTQQLPQLLTQLAGGKPAVTPNP